MEWRIVAPTPTDPPVTPTCPPKPDGWTAYSVHKGDTLWDFSQRHGTTVKAIKAANCLEKDVIIVGQKILLPPLPEKTQSPTPTAVRTPTAIPTQRPGPTVVIEGIVLPQGSDDLAGTEVYLREGACSDSRPPVPDAVTDDDGYFELALGRAQTYACLQLFRPGYLMAETRSLEGDLGAITLPAGDVTQDNQIDRSDLELITGCFLGPGDDAADLGGECFYTSEDQQVLIVNLNQDRNVDVYDLAMASRNFGRTGPVDEWVVPVP